MMNTISFTGSNTLPLFNKGDNIGKAIIENFSDIENEDIFVIAQKIISKVEGRIINLDELDIGEKAKELSEKTGRNPALCQAILNASKEILNIKRKVIETKLKNGMVCTSAGIDKSNIENGGKNVILLPEDSDKSAKEIREEIEKNTGKAVAVIINDSLGHPNRMGSIGMAIGISGISALETSSGKDLYGNESSPTISKIDEIAAGASILMGQGDERIPVVQVKGVKYTRNTNSSIKEAICQ